MTSMSDSTQSLHVIKVILNLDIVSYLGISLVGHTSSKGDGGIYVSQIMPGGAVALDGRIDPGDMILQVNDVSFESLSNDEAVQVLREAVKKPGPITMLVAKCWDPSPQKGHFTIPRSEPVRPIDPEAWVAHSMAAMAKLMSKLQFPFSSFEVFISLVFETRRSGKLCSKQFQWSTNYESGWIDASQPLSIDERHFGDHHRFCFFRLLHVQSWISDQCWRWW